MKARRMRMVHSPMLAKKNNKLHLQIIAHEPTNYCIHIGAVRTVPELVDASWHTGRVHTRAANES